jgi:hypothetical protein
LTVIESNPNAGLAAVKVDPGFHFSQLVSSRMAVWPIQNLETDPETRKVILQDYDNQEEFLNAFSLKLSSRLIPACQVPSLDSTAVADTLAAGGQTPLLDTTRFIQAMAAQTPAGSAPASPKMSVNQLPAMKGIRFALLFRNFHIERPKIDVLSEKTVRAPFHDQGAEESRVVFLLTDHIANPLTNGDRYIAGDAAALTKFEDLPAQTRTKGVLRMALMDLETGAIVWEETFHAEAGPDVQQGFYDVQELLAARILKRFQRR